MTTSLLPHIEINPDGQPKASIIWLHGLGADGNDFVNIASELNLPAELKLRFVFPHAPLRPVTINNGYVMRAWYDIESLDINQKSDIQGIEAATKSIEKLIEHEIELGISSSNIILAGFSQGGAIALHTGLHYQKTLGGIVALSTYLPIFDSIDEKSCQLNLNTPIMMVHGTLDNVLPISLGKYSYQLLLEKGFNIQWKTYAMQHNVCEEEIQYIGNWLLKLIQN